MIKSHVLYRLSYALTLALRDGIGVDRLRAVLQSNMACADA